MDKVRRKDVIVTRHLNGSYECAAIVDTHRVSQVYYGYTKRESVSEFVKSVNHTATREGA